MAKCSLGSSSARLLCLLRARLAALGSSALPGRGSATGWVPSHHRFHCLWTFQVSMTRGERLLVSSEEAPEGWVLAARAAEPAVVGYVPLTYVQKVPSATGFVEQERAHARRQEAEKAEAAAAAVYTQAKTKTGLQSAGQAVINIVKARKGQAQAFAPDDLDLATTQMREEYAKVGPAEARKAEEARLAAVKAAERMSEARE